MKSKKKKKVFIIFAVKITGHRRKEGRRRDIKCKIKIRVEKSEIYKEFLLHEEKLLQ